MIIRDVNGNLINTTTYDNAAKSDNRDFLVKLLMNGNELSCGVKRLEYSKGSVGDTNQFSIGSVIGGSMTAEVLDLTDDVKNQELEVQVGLYVNDTWIWIRVGKYTISEVKKTIYGSTLTGFGKLVSNSGGQFIEPGTKTLSNIGTEIGTELGCTVYFGSGIDTSLVVNESMNGLTTYQAIQVVCELVGGYARDMADGNVSISLFQTTYNRYSVDSGMMTTLPDVEEQNFEITGVQCIVSEASSDSTGDIPAVGYTQGNPINLSFNNKYMTQDLFTQAATQLIGYEYRPGSINLSLGTPRLEGTDILEVTDADNSVYLVPLHSVRHIYDGGFRSEIVAAAATHIENSIGTVAPLQQQKKDTDQKFVEVEAEIENLADGVQYFWYDNDGAHVSTISKARYQETRPAQTCIEVLITSTDIIFRKGRQGLQGTWNWTIYATYSNTGIELGDYASMTDSGIILGDVNDSNYQLELNPSQGLLLNGKPIILSDYATQAVTERTTAPIICPGMIGSGSTSLYFTVPLECIIPEGTSINIDTLKANIKIDGSSYFVDAGYTSGGKDFTVSGYTLSGTAVGTALTILISKSSTFKQGNTSTAVSEYSSLTVSLNDLQWTKPASSRNLRNSGETEEEER